MTGEDQDDTQQAPEPVEPETAVVPTDASTVDAAELAWSAETEEPEAARRSWANTWKIASVILGCAAALAVSVFAWRAVHKHESVLPSLPQPTATTQPAVKPSAPPQPTTVTAPPVTVTPPPTALPSATTAPSLVLDAAGDQRLLAQLRKWSTTSPLVDSDPAQLIRYAHQFCQLLNQGERGTQALADIQAASGWDNLTTVLVTGQTLTAYPGCS